MKLGCYLSFYSEIRTVRLILGLGFPLVSRSHSFLSSLDPDPVKSFFFFPSLLWSDVCDCACSALPPVACSRWIASTTVLWWRFTMNLWESLEIASDSFAFRLCLLLWIGFSDGFNEFVWNCAELVLELVLGFMNVLELFWVCCDFWSVTAKREKTESVCDLALTLYILALILTLCTIYSLPCVLWANELVTRGLDLACVAFWTELASFWPWGPICKYAKYGTTLQITTGLFLKE